MGYIQHRGLEGIRPQPLQERAIRADRLRHQESVVELARQATTSAAAQVAEMISTRYRLNPPNDKKSLSAFKVELDHVAVDAMSRVLHEQKTCKFHTVGSEGGKELLKDGAASAQLNGSHGLVEDHSQEHDTVSDALEGTTAASKNETGAVSALAVSSRDGLLASQDENGNFYLEKLFGPRELVGILSLDFSPEENLILAQGVLGENFKVVILNRPRNAEHIASAQRLGVEVLLIEAGDFMPSLLAVCGPQNVEDKHVLVMGSGGYEEGVMAAAAARARGGLGQARVWSDPASGTPLAPLLTLDKLVPGSANETAVTVTAITDDPWFGLRRASVLDGNSRASGKQLDSLIITSHGVEIKTSSPAMLR